MVAINGINEVANPLIIIVPLVLMTLSGYTIGRSISQIFKKESNLLTELLCGNTVLIFVFISGFIVFGVLFSAANTYFTIFTYLTVVLAIFGILIIWKSRIILFKSRRLTKHIMFAIGLFLTLLVYQGLVTYYHPIFLEYDSIYFFLLISKSILLGDGLNQDFFIGSEVALKLPPLNQATNAWLIQSFGYSAMRLFPIYFVFLGSLFVYFIAKNVTKDSFLGMIASSAFLITPALLIVSSHFSLQQDIPFIFLLCAVLYFSSEILRSEKLLPKDILMLILSLSLLSLTREIGVVVSVAVFFLLPAMKFSRNKFWLKVILTVLSLSPLYLLTLYDIFSNGLTNSMAIRLLSLILANAAILYISYHMKNQKQIKEYLVTNLKYSLFLIFPLIFFVGNIISIGGPFATIIFSSQFGESAIMHRQVFDITKDLELSEALRQNLPRPDIFLVAVSMGSTFVFLRLRGFVRLVEPNSQYQLLLIMSIVLLVVWSYLLESGFQSARIRHIAYFLPITSTLIVIAMNRDGTGYRLIYFGIIVFSTYYFLNYDLEIWNYRGHFGGFYIEPYRSAIMNLADFIPALIIIVALLIYEYKEKKINLWVGSLPYLNRSSGFVFLALLAIQLYILSSSGLTFSSLSILDQDPPPDWEENVFEIVDYLNEKGEGDVLSLRAPAISFFTNRTNFDLYNPHTFSRISPLLFEVKNSVEFKEKLSEMGIKFIVLPHERSRLYDLTQNFDNSSIIPEIIANDRDFERKDFTDFSVYDFDQRQMASIDLLNHNNTWKSFGPYTQVSRVDGSLRILVLSTGSEKIYNRAYTEIELNSSEIKSMNSLSLEYKIESDSARLAEFVIELRDENNKHLWGHLLLDTNGTSIRQEFVLPEGVTDGYTEFRLYVVTESLGRHALDVTDIRLSSE